MSLQGLLTFDRQLAFAASRALNRTVLLGREAVREALHETFTIRTRWVERGPLRVEAKFSNKNNLTASVSSGAGFLALQERGGTKKPVNKALAIPTDAVRRSKRGLIRAAEKPRNLKGQKFVLQSKHGPVLAQRVGKKKRLRILYGLEDAAKIKPAPTFLPNVRRIVKEQFAAIFREELRAALENAK